MRSLIMGSGGAAPARKVQGQSPWSGGRGQSTLEAESLVAGSTTINGKPKLSLFCVLCKLLIKLFY